MGIEAFALPIGTVLNERFMVRKILGNGGFGITYEVYDKVSKNRYAVKEYFPKDISVRNPETNEIMPAAEQYISVFNHGKERFLEEAEILEKFVNAPNIVNVYDFFIQNGTCYFVMELLEGRPLNRIRKECGGSLSWEQLKPIIKKAGEALMTVHSNGVFHRDAGPDNIFVLNDGNVKLIDFGNSKNLTRKEGEKLSVYLKLGFAPPEQYSSSARQGTFTDVYTLGATIYYMLAGQKLPEPFTIQSNGYKRLTQFGVEKYVSDAVDKALMFRPKDRTQTIGEFMCNLGLMQPQPTGTVAVARLVPFIIIRIDGMVKDQYRLNVNTTYTIGRFPETANISISEVHLSRVHCEVFYDTLSNEFYIVDHSLNGTYIGNTRLERDKINKAKLGTFLYLGGPRCQIELGAMYA